MKKILPTLLFIFLISNLSIVTLLAQTPCSGGSAGVYGCSNVDLEAYISLAEFGSNGTNDIWGWTSTSGGEYAIIGLQDGTSFVDVSNPSAPVILGKLPKHSGTLNSTWRDIKVVGNHAYIGSEATGHGIQIFDLTELLSVSNPPVVFSESGWINLTSLQPGSPNKSHNIVSSPLTGHILAVGTSSLHSGGLTFFDVNSNPTSPNYVGSYSSAGYSHDALCTIYRGADDDHIGKEICIGFNDNIVAITDVTDKNNPIPIKSFSYPGNDYCHQGWLTEDQKYLLVDDELDENGPSNPTRTYIFDVSDLDNPFLKYTYTAPTNSIDHNQYVKGPFVYQANYTSGLRIFDVSNLDNSPPSLVGFFDNYPDDDDGTFDGTWSVYPYFKSGTMIMTNIDGSHGGLHIVTPNISHYVLEVEGTGVESVCQGQSATFTFDATSYAGFSSVDNITISGVPSGATASLNNNPIAPDGQVTMTVTTTNSTAIGKYNIILTGSETPVNRVSVGLEVTTINENLPATDLVLPSNGMNEVPTDVQFDWDPVPGGFLYDLEISTDDLFNSIDFTITDILATEYLVTGLSPDQRYYWRVRANSANCQTSSSFNINGFQTIEAPLPAELISFTATAEENYIDLDWQTGSELGFAGFDLEKTTQPNNSDFRKITWIPAQGINSTAIQTYQFLDKDVLPGQVYYYRLRQIDLDGSDEFSPIASARLAGDNAALQIFPNPATEEVTLFLEQNIGNEDVDISLYDITGKLIRNLQLSTDELNGGYTLDISELVEGIYMISLKNEEVNASTQLIKR
ncbi:MAG: choice-of-anchor B family protein [Saprospiraceae bacterium]